MQRHTTSRALRLRQLAVASLIAIAVPVTATATTRAITPLTGPFSAEAGDKLLISTVATLPAQTRMNVTVTVDNGDAVDIVDTQCEIDPAEATMSCLNVGTANMTVVDAANKVFVFDPAHLDVIEWEQDDLVPEPVRINWLGVCVQELNDFGDCRNSCKERYPGTNGAAITSIGPGCILLCTCYDNNGNKLATIEGADTHVGI
jgi:hypothetical protein